MPRAPKTPTATSNLSGPRLVRKVPSTRSSASAAVPHEQIALKAYWLFLERGCVHGHDLDDWLTAERELLKPKSGSMARRAG
jgi:hypothetical protein